MLEMKTVLVQSGQVSKTTAPLDCPRCFAPDVSVPVHGVASSSSRGGNQFSQLSMNTQAYSSISSMHKSPELVAEGPYVSTCSTQRLSSCYSRRLAYRRVQSVTPAAGCTGRCIPERFSGARCACHCCILTCAAVLAEA